MAVVLPPLPALPGSYALRLVLQESGNLAIGRLGSFFFPAGNYLYFGSAHGPGGLKARLLHHSRPAARPHWHIDWLRAWAALAGGWYSLETGPLECTWSKALPGQAPGCAVPAPGFGAADCRRGCPAHLLWLPGSWNDDQIAALLGAHLPGQALLHPFGLTFLEEKNSKARSRP